MKRILAAVALFAGAMMVASPASAHHSVTGIFLADKAESLEGRLVSVEWVNPHIYFNVDVTDKAGKVTKWRFESLPPAFMRRAGLTRDLVMDDGGKPVKILYNPPRDPKNHTGFALRFTYADGHEYTIGNIPPGAK